MRIILILLLHLLTRVLKVLGTGGARAVLAENLLLNLANYRWQSYCNGLFQLLIAA